MSILSAGDKFVHLGINIVAALVFPADKHSLKNAYIQKNQFTVHKARESENMVIPPSLSGSFSLSPTLQSHPSLSSQLMPST